MEHRATRRATRVKKSLRRDTSIDSDIFKKKLNKKETASPARPISAAPAEGEGGRAAPVVGGAAVTEEFHPGFRNSVASYTVSLLNPKIIRDLDLAEHGLRIVERRAPTSCRARRQLPADRRGPHKQEIAKFSAARRRALRRLRRRDRSHRRRAARPRAAATAQPRRGLAPAASANSSRPPHRQRDLRAPVDEQQPGPARPLHQIGRRLPRRLVRDRPRQGALRLRRHRRQLRQPLHARHRLCAAAPCLRRGERQEGRLGPRHRRHGRDHAGHGARARAAGVEIETGAPCAR